MCITPSFIYLERGPGNLGGPKNRDAKSGYQKIPVPCKRCWRCRSNRVNDFVGRALCEADSSDWTCTLTLTYAPRDDLADKVLTPRHYQDFIRSFRDRHRKNKKMFANKEHSIRYFAAGEYGDLKGRAHFHTILFGKGEPPEIPHQRNSFIPEWPHGHVFADWNADEASIRYVMKYLLQDQKGLHWHTMSKKPPLGADFFRRKADEAIRFEVFPSSFEYLPPGGHKGRPYLMTGATRRDYLRQLLVGIAHKKTRKGQFSEWVEKAIDKVNRFEVLEAIKGQDIEENALAFIQELDANRLSMSDAKYQVYKSTVRAEFEADQVLERMVNNVQERPSEAGRTADQGDPWNDNQDPTENWK